MRLTLFLFSCFILLSCSEPSILSQFPASQNMQKPILVGIQSDSIQDPYMLECINGKLYFANLRSKKILSEFDLSLGNHRGGFLNRGNSPNDFQFLTNMYRFDNSLTLWDSSSSTLSFIDPSNHSIERKIKISPNASLLSPFQVMPISDRRLIATGILSKGRVALLDEIGKELFVFGTYPKEDKGREYTHTENAFAYQSHAAYQSKKNRLVLGAYWGESIVFYDLSDNNNPKQIKEYIYSYPKYTDNSDNSQSSVKFKKGNISGFIDIKASSKYCVCLYSGEPYYAGEEYGGDKILMFDWEGNPVKYIKLDKKYSNLAVSEETQEAILIGTDPKTLEYVVAKVEL